MAKKKKKAAAKKPKAPSAASRIGELEKAVADMEEMVMRLVCCQGRSANALANAALDARSTLDEVRFVISRDVGRPVSRVGADDPLSFFYDSDGALRDFYMRKINDSPFNCRPPVTIAAVPRTATVRTLAAVVDARRTT